MTKSGDTLVVTNHRPIRADTAELDLVTRYGDFEGPASLSHIYSLAVDGEGAVYLYDNNAGVKRFAWDGAYEGVVAREGGGPREVGYVPALAVGADGRITALDLGNRRLVTVWPNGSSREVRLPEGQARYHEDAVHFGTDGSEWLGFNPPFGSDGEEQLPRLAYLRVHEDGTYPDSIVLPERYWRACPTVSDHLNRRGFWEDRRAPYVPKVTWSRGPNGIVAIGCPATYEFDVLHPDQTIIRIRRQREPVHLSSTEQAFLARWVDMPGLPRERPAFARIVVSGDGRIWVWPTQPMQARTPPESVRQQTGVDVAYLPATRGAFDVFEDTGAWLGTVRMPSEVQYSGFPTTPGLVIRGDTIWAVSRDSLDVQYVSRYLVRWTN